MQSQHPLLWVCKTSRDTVIKGITSQWCQPLERLRLFCILAEPLQRSAHFQVRQTIGFPSVATAKACVGNAFFCAAALYPVFTDIWSHPFLIAGDVAIRFPCIAFGSIFSSGVRMSTFRAKSRTRRRSQRRGGRERILHFLIRIAHGFGFWFSLA